MHPEDAPGSRAETPGLGCFRFLALWRLPASGGQSRESRQRTVRVKQGCGPYFKSRSRFLRYPGFLMKPRCDELPGGGRNRLGVHSSAQPGGFQPDNAADRACGRKESEKKGITPNVHFVEMLQTH
jgi:hypothetical protein